MGILVYLTIVAYTNGDVWRLLAPWDPDSRSCGVRDYKAYKYIYFNIPCPNKVTLFTNNICVDKCPKADDSNSVDGVPI